MPLRTAVVAFAFGFGIFLAFVGSSIIAPPDPFTQLLIVGPLFVVIVPVIYRVMVANGVGNGTNNTRGSFRYLVAVTLGSSIPALVASTLLSTGRRAILVRGGFFLAGFCIVSWLVIRSSPSQP